MGTDTTPYFVVGSGRSGTRTIFKMLSGIESLEIHHEFVCTHVQQLSALYFMGLIGSDEVKRRLADLHGSAIFYSQAAKWVDCSNKLSWIIEPLHDLYPRARFVHLIRDGRKVANSYYHKLADEMYDDLSVSTMQRWLAGRDSLPMPPPEKRFWWNIPQPGQPFFREFPRFNQFERACYQWVESNRVIRDSLAKLPCAQYITIKLEELTTDPDQVARFLEFFEIDYEDHFFEFLQTPQNVIFPMDFKLAQVQVGQFEAIAGRMMDELGYAHTEEYTVRY